LSKHDPLSKKELDLFKPNYNTKRFIDSYCKRKGFEKDLLQVLLDGNNAPYPDEYFDITFSNQVFEHIKDIDRVAGEIYRITKKGGVGYHVFPAFLYPNEGHLHVLCALATKKLG